MTQKSMIANDETSSQPVILREGDEVAFTIPVRGVTVGITDPTQTFYKEGTTTDLSSTYFTGSMSISGINTVVTKVTSSLKAGDYILSVFGTVDGLTQCIKTIPISVKRRGVR